MGLCYGFNYSNDEHKEEFDAYYESLSDHDKDVYHNMIPWAMMFTDIGVICQDSIPHFIDRLRIFYDGPHRDLCKAAGEESLDRYLRRFIGMTANVLTLSDTEFLKKFKNKLYMKPKDAKRIKEHYKHINLWAEHEVLAS
jgi:hypothetical protein